MDSDDADFFAFNAVNGPFEIKVENNTRSGGFWPYVTVYDGTGKAIADKFPERAGEGVMLTVPDDTGGPVRIGIVGRNFTSGPFVLTVGQRERGTPPTAKPSP